MVTRAVVFTGLIRDETKFIRFLKHYKSTKENFEINFYLSTWEGELDEYPEIKKNLIEINAFILEQKQPDLVLPGHVLHQIAALDFPLSIIDSDVFIYKSRPDFADTETFNAFIKREPERIDNSFLRDIAPSHKIYILGYFPAHPFYINDIIYCGMCSDIIKNVSLPFVTMLRYNRIAPEQLIWSHWGMELSYVDRYMRCNVGLIFDSNEKSNIHIDLLKSSWCYVYAVALYMLIINAWFSDFRTDDSLAEQIVSENTLEELFWSPIDNGLVSHHTNALNNSFKSTIFASYIISGNFKKSKFGDMFNEALNKVRSSSIPTDEIMNIIESSALNFEASINRMIPGVGGKCIQRREKSIVIEGPPPRWIKEQTGSTLTKSLEDEVNYLRRENNTLLQRLKVREI